MRLILIFALIIALGEQFDTDMNTRAKVPTSGARNTAAHNAAAASGAVAAAAIPESGFGISAADLLSFEEVAEEAKPVVEEVGEVAELGVIFEKEAIGNAVDIDSLSPPLEAVE